MFVRFRQTRSRLQASLIETRRIDGKVRHEHIASLGSIVLSPTVSDRVAFWSGLHQRMANLSNRLDAAAQAKLMGEVHGRVPMVTPDEQRALQLENATIEAQRWSAVREKFVSDVAANELLAADAATKIAAGNEAVAIADGPAREAQARIDAIERGESVEGGLSKPMDVLTYLKSIGWSEADIRLTRLVGSIPEEHFEEFLRESSSMREMARHRHVTRAAHAILRKHGTR